METQQLPLGHTVITPGALAELSLADIRQAIERHARGDWGDVPPEDRKANDEAKRHGDRVLSAYKTSTGIRFWVVTEADRSVTTVLLPEEY